MITMYYFFSRRDDNKEPIGKCTTFSRLKAAKYFAQQKRLDLKSFLSIYAVSR